MSLLAVIDVQRGFINEWTGHIPAAVEAAQAGFDRVFVSRFVNLPDSPYRRLIGWERFSPGSPETALAFAPRPYAMCYEKSIYSALTPGLLAAARDQPDLAVHLCGIATDNCVLKTAADLFEAGILPVVHADWCASHGGADFHQTGLAILRRLIGDAQVV
ncbi:MAG TPA: isochorismatase family protein [Alphaproteobacteria bacterium]|nr:isochorismatase family protein [Alphaproteobacteria bacterium]